MADLILTETDKNNLENWAKIDQRYFVELAQYYFAHFPQIYRECIIPIYEKHIGHYAYPRCPFCDYIGVPVKQSIKRGGHSKNWITGMTKTVYKEICKNCKTIINEYHR